MGWNSQTFGLSGGRCAKLSDMRTLVIVALLLAAVLVALNFTGSETGRTLPEASATDR